MEYFDLEPKQVDALYLMLDSGADEKETARRLKLPIGAVRYYKKKRKVEEPLNIEKTNDLEKIEELFFEKPFNEDRHLCKKCIHRAKNLSEKAVGRPGCDYVCNTDKERGCDVEICNKFEEGESLSIARSKKYEKGKNSLFRNKQ